MEDEEYLTHARQAERFARLSATAEERAAYERIAAAWRELADAAAVKEGSTADVSPEGAERTETPRQASATSQ